MDKVNKIIISIISTILLFTPLILLIILWFLIDEEYRTPEFRTILFTINLFLMIFMLEKIYNTKSFNII